MSKLIFSYKEHRKILKAYGFVENGFNKSSHNTFSGKINGQDRIVQIIYNKHEKKRQSDRTMKHSVKNSGISREYYEDWKKNKIVHNEII